MPDNFDWRTEEERDEVWQDTAPAEPAPSARRRWWLVLLLAVLVLGGLYAAYSAAEERVTEAEALTAEDVLASHRLAQAAAEDGDRELLATVLSGRDQRWTQTQFRLMEERLLFDGAVRALGLQPLEEPGAIVDVSFSPDLRQAEVVSEQQVVREQGDEVITLRQVHVYRRGDQGWLLSPPEAEFWGPWRLWQGQRLTLHYTERDAAFAERLAPDLDSMLGQMCDALQGLDCPPDLRVRVRLDRDPASVQLAARSQVSTMVAGELTLPGATLIGEPPDDASYSAFYSAYARRLASAVVSDLVGYRCCDQIVFFRATLDWQLAQLGLQPWPLTLDHYLQVAQELDGPGRLAHLWSLSELPAGGWPDRWHAYSLVAFLLRQEEGSVNAAMLQRRLGAASTAMRWIEIVSDYRSVNSLETAWRGYIAERIGDWQAAPPPPEQELVLACREDDRAAIFRYNPSLEHWRRGLPGLEITPGANVSTMVGLPDGSGLLVATWDPAAESSSLFLWRAGRVARLQTNRTSFELHSARHIDPLGEHAGVWAWSREHGDSGYALLDLESCESGACAWEAIGGWPIWSPDGQHILYSQEDNAILRSAIVRRPREALAPRQVAYGFQPFWLNRQTFGYFAGGELVLVRAPDGQQATVLTLGDLYRRVVGDDNPTRHFTAEHVLASPDDNALVFFLRNHGVGESFVIRLRGQEGQSWLNNPPPPEAMEVLLQTGELVFGPPLATISPGGRWLTLQTVGQGEAEFIIYDLETGAAVMRDGPRAIRPTKVVWSQDGRWLARLSGHYVEAIAPEHGPYRRPLLPLSDSSQATPICDDLAWIDPVSD